MLHTTVGESVMKVTYDQQLTALLVIDPYQPATRRYSE